MVSTHPYSPPIAGEAAVAELRRCGGSQFDATVVAAFCAGLDQLAAAGQLLATAGLPRA